MNNKAKILLVRPLVREYINSQSSARFEASIGLVPPLNLCCLAAALEQAGHEVGIYDCEANGNDETLLAEYLAEHEPAVVGISIITTNFRGAHETARVIRRVLPRATIVAGGTHMTIFPVETLSFPEFDYGFSGEAERPCVEFLSVLEKGTPDWRRIPGLVWRNGTGVTVNEPCGFNAQLDELPFPAYHLLDLSAYRMPNVAGNVISLYLSRGCPFNCGFCFRNPQLKKVRFKSVDRAIAEIGWMVEKFHVRSINFVDETISLRKEYFLEFCRKLAEKKWNIEWQSPTRVTSIDEDIARGARASGCHAFRIGIESGSDEILEKIGKGITVEQSRRAVQLCRKHGIKTVGYFIIGYLGETEETIRRTARFARELKLDYAAFFPATPMPGTELCRQCEEQGLIPKNYWRDFVLGKRHDALAFIFPGAGEWTSRAYRAFYFSPANILRQMKSAKFYKDLPRNARAAANLLMMKSERQGRSVTS